MDPEIFIAAPRHSRLPGPIRVFVYRLPGHESLREKLERVE
jgi:hypothetical protein